jgi:hypothetical protein
LYQANLIRRHSDIECGTEESRVEWRNRRCVQLWRAVLCGVLWTTAWVWGWGIVKIVDGTIERRERMEGIGSVDGGW